MHTEYGDLDVFILFNFIAVFLPNLLDFQHPPHLDFRLVCLKWPRNSLPQGSWFPCHQGDVRLDLDRRDDGWSRSVNRMADL